MVKSDKWIRMMAKEHGLIDPFLEHPLRSQGVISSGLTQSGYDVRLTDRFEVFRPTPTNTIVDPKNFDMSALMSHIGKECIIPANSFVLGHSMERFKIPRNIKGFCEGKSSYARCGIVIPVTPLEQGWEGVLTIEIINATPLPAKIYAFEGIAQISFFDAEECEADYKQRSGKYQNQTGITLPSIFPYSGAS